MENKTQYIVRWHENTQGGIRFNNLGEARLYAKNVSFYHAPYECTINEYCGNEFVRIVNHYILGMQW